MSGDLRRTLGLSDAVIIGAGSMIGAGVFVAWSPAAQAAGDGLLVGLAIAGVIAFCNATSSAQLSAIHPESGGTYVYGRRQLGPGWGHAAGWGFVVGKTASCAAMALTLGAYAAPDHQRLVGSAAVAAITAVNIGGLSRTVAVTRVLLCVSALALATVVVVGWSGADADVAAIAPGETDLAGVLQSAGFMFFAFAGYARIATLGEEVVKPERTIPRAIPTALGGVLVIYAVVAVTLLAVVPSEAVAATDAPLRLVMTAADSPLGPIVRVGAAIASLGVLLNLIPGVSRTALAMARNHELPSWLAHVDGERALPVRAELTVAAVVVGLVVTLDVRSSIAVSGGAVLLYYAVTNAAALSLDPEHRRFPRPLAVVGLVGCVVLIGALPASALAGGGLVLVAGLVARAIALRAHR